MWRKNGMPAILYPLPKMVKKFNTIVFTGGTTILVGNRDDYRGNLVWGYKGDDMVGTSLAAVDIRWGS
jgi:hypothetical protein